MNAKLYNQVEIAFWDFFIYTLSESQFVRRFIRGAFQFSSRWSLAIALVALFCSALIGLFSGMLLYVLAFLIQ